MGIWGLDMYMKRGVVQDPGVYTKIPDRALRVAAALKRPSVAEWLRVQGIM